VRVRAASCNCDYDFGGHCKHIVALLLTYARDPEQFVVREDMAKRLAEVASDIPQALLPYCEATHEPNGDVEHQIKTLQQGWRPEYFKIEAPGLSAIWFTVDRRWNPEKKEPGPPHINKLSTSGQHCDDHQKWYLAIATAARLRAEHDAWNAKEAEREERYLALLAKPEPPPEPTLAERLEEIVRAIARDEVKRSVDF